MALEQRCLSVVRRGSAQRGDGVGWGRAVGQFITLLAVILMAAAPWTAVSANGNSVEIFRGRQGPYELTVGAQPAEPVVGPIHFTITPRNAETLQPVTDARVEVVINDPQGRPTFRAPALSLPAEPQDYDANLTIDSSGLWTLIVIVQSDELGEATFSVPLEVGEAAIGSSLTGTILWVGMILVLATGGLYVWRSGQRRRV